MKYININIKDNNKAENIKIKDANENFENDNVEGALDEICTKVENNTHTHANKAVLDGITQTKISEWNSKSDFSGSYNDLTDKPTIATKTSQLTNDSNYATQTYVQNKIAEASLNGGQVDLSGYVTNEIGNANQITFSDGQTFQTKLNAGLLKGQDGLTTKISMNGTTYTHVGGTITLPNCATQTYVIDKINEALSQGGGNNGNISVSYDEINEELTFSGTANNEYNENEESLTIGGTVN